jgi:hypothetical protein
MRGLILVRGGIFILLPIANPIIENKLDTYKYVLINFDYFF